MNQHRYDYTIEPGQQTTSNTIIGWAGEGRRVLELGTAAGVMSKEFHGRGCRVVGIEYDAALADEARQWCEAMHVADLEQFDFATLPGAGEFDVVIAADVLEHLRNPDEVLRRLRAVVPAGCELLLSIPHVGYAGLQAALHLGRFDYREKGLLDRTHVRFFTRRSIDWLLLETGWLAVEWRANRVPMHHSEYAEEWFTLDERRRSDYAASRDADVYQFLVRAVPATDVGYTVRARQEMEEHRRQTDARHAIMEAEVIHSQRLLEQSQARFDTLDAEHIQQSHDLQHRSDQYADAKAHFDEQVLANAALNQELATAREHAGAYEAAYRQAALIDLPAGGLRAWLARRCYGLALRLARRG